MYDAHCAHSLHLTIYLRSLAEIFLLLCYLPAQLVCCLLLEG